MATNSSDKDSGWDTTVNQWNAELNYGPYSIYRKSVRISVYTVPMHGLIPIVGG